MSAARKNGREGPAGAEEARLQAEFEQRVLHDRNGRLAERMEPRLQAGGAFIAVGALHLLGDRGVLAELERRGYRLTVVY